MNKLNIFGMEFIYRVRSIKSVWAVDRLDKSLRFQLGKLVIYKMDRGTFWNIKSIVDRKGMVTVAQSYYGADILGYLLHIRRLYTDISLIH